MGEAALITRYKDKFKSGSHPVAYKNNYATWVVSHNCSK